MKKDMCTTGDNAILMVSAEVWKYDLAQRVESSLPPLPPLDKFTDALMSYWLRMPEEEYSKDLLWSMSLASLIYYAYNLKSKEGQA